MRILPGSFLAGARCPITQSRSGRVQVPLSMSDKRVGIGVGVGNCWQFEREASTPSTNLEGSPLATRWCGLLGLSHDDLVLFPCGEPEL